MIDSWLRPGGWPPQVLSAVRLFRQGHLIAWNSVVYGADFTHAICEPTKKTSTSGTGYTKISEIWPFVAITSQTCDICEDGKRKPNMPWIEVAPAYDILPFLSNPGQANQIRANGFKYLVPLTHPDFLLPETLWVVDLRIEYPLEKSFLVDQAPRFGFSQEEHYQYFADKLASRRNRAALDSRVRDLIIAPLGAAFSAGTIDHNPIVEVRLQCGPTWDRVERVQIIAVVHDDCHVTDVEDQFDAWQDVLQSKLPPDLSLLPTKSIPFATLSYQEALRTIPVDYSETSP